MPEPGAEEAKAPEDAKTESSTVNSSGGGGESEKSTAIPQGIIPIFFTGAGQKIFECVVDHDVTPEMPNKLIAKNKIVEDFRNRAAVSDFHPVKKKVQVRKILYNAHHN